MCEIKNSVSGKGAVTATTTEGVENNIHRFEYEWIDCTYNEETQTLTVGNSICVTGVSKDKVGEAVSNLLDISNTYGYIMGDYGDVISANSDTLTVKKIAKMVEEYVHTTKEEMWEKEIDCDGEIDMGWQHFSEDDKKFLLDSKRHMNDVRHYLMNYGHMIDSVYHIEGKGLKIFFDC